MGLWPRKPSPLLGLRPILVFALAALALPITRLPDSFPPWWVLISPRRHPILALAIPALPHPSAPRGRDTRVSRYGRGLRSAPAIYPRSAAHGCAGDARRQSPGENRLRPAGRPS